MIARTIWRGIGCLAVLLFVWSALACGGGGGGGPTQPPPPPPPPPPPTGVTFTASGPAVENSVYLAVGQGGGGSLFVLEVRVMEVIDLYGVSFTLEFPNDLLRFQKNGTTEGSFLSGEDNARTELVVQNKPAGELVIGHTRIGDAPGVDGSGTLFSLEFTTRGSGTDGLELTRHDLLDRFGQVQAGVTWIGGSVEVTGP